MVFYKGRDSQKNWSLFLDRDGVINERLPGDYIKEIVQFKFIDGVVEALASLSAIFEKIIIVSNQQGIGKKIMTEEELDAVHRFMVEKIEQSGGRIDAIYHCPALESDNHPDRKPKTGMAMKAKSDFPELEFSRSFMVGDSLSDIEFGKAISMKTVFICGSESDTKKSKADLYFSSLAEFAKYMEICKNSLFL
jgi:histidinol-phosphate phosphatase family protein